MSTDIRKNDKRDYVEKVMSMTDARFISEAESFRFEKRRTPVSTWIAAACFALIFAAAAILLIKPLRERPVVIPANSSEPTASPTAAPAEKLIFSEGNEFPNYGANVLESYDAIVLEFPKGNPYFTGEASRALGAKLLLPKGWTVRNGLFEGLGYYPAEEFVSYCIASRPGNDIMSVYNEKGECVGSIGLAATSAEYPGLDQAFAVITMGEGAFRFNDEETAKVGSGKNGEAYIGRARYAEKLADLENRRTLALPALISYDTEFLVGIVTEFGENAVTNEQLTQIAESVRFALLNEASGETPAPAPSQAPIPYNREEYDTLLAFFELKDENGVKNGEKCFNDYDPNQVDFWGEDPEEDAEESRLIWEDGKLRSIILEGLSDETKLVGSIRLDIFGSLKEFSANRMIFESFNGDLRNSFNAIDESDEYLMFGCEGENVLIADFITVFHIGSFSHCRYESTDEEHGGALAFTADLTADGSGHVGVFGHPDPHHYIVEVYAEPKEGNEFIGWYDAEGSLISTEETIEISYIDENGTGVHDFTGTARFEPEIVADPWYLEKAWEYAEFANREYGFNFIKDEAKFSNYDKCISFAYSSGEEFANAQSIMIFFKKDAKAVAHVYIFGDSSDKPEEYASMSDEELRALYDQLNLFATYSVTREDMLRAGYTLDGTDEDYVKIAEYCGKLKAAALMSCNELHYNHCIKADAGNAQRNTVDYVMERTNPVYYWGTYYFRPSYPKLFTDAHADIGCSMIPLDDADYPGWITFTGDVLISETADGWSCELAYISGY